jgi:hypothetical protein
VKKVQTLKALEVVLESFLARAVALKEERLKVLEGINRLDDIAREVHRGDDITDEIGGWFAEHNRWVSDETLRPGDHGRISEILKEIKRELRVSMDSSPAVSKIAQEIDRWGELQGQTSMSRQGDRLKLSPAPRTEQSTGTKVVLKRGSEARPAGETDSISMFAQDLDFLTRLFKDFSGDKQHLMSVLDEALKSAETQSSKEALLLSALIIYYLRQNGYKTGPYVKRLRAAERLQKGAVNHA